MPLMKSLIESGYTLLLETSGERPLAAVPPSVFKIVDVKCPDSGAGGSFRLANLECLGSHDEIKFVTRLARRLRVCARVHYMSRACRQSRQRHLLARLP